MTSNPTFVDRRVLDVLDKTIAAGESRTLKHIVSDLGYSLAPSRFDGFRRVLDDAGEKLFEGTSGMIWTWLGETGQLPGCEVVP